MPYDPKNITFDEKCKNCGTEMDEVHSDGKNMRGTDYWYWCPSCGALFHWYDAYLVDTGLWKIPERTKK